MFPILYHAEKNRNWNLVLASNYIGILPHTGVKDFSLSKSKNDEHSKCINFKAVPTTILKQRIPKLLLGPGYKVWGLAI